VFASVSIDVEKGKYMREKPLVVTNTSRNVTTASLIARVIIGGLLAAAVLTPFALIQSSGNRSTVSLVQTIIIQVVSGVGYVVLMTPLARKLAERRVLLIFLPLYVTSTLTNLIEAYFYTSLFTPFTLVAALILEGFPLLVITGIITWLIPADEEAHHVPRLGQIFRERTVGSWLWRMIAAGAPYPLIYLFFARLVTPIEHPYYADPAFIASLHTVVPPFLTTLILEAVRGVLFVLAVVPVMAVFRTSRWSTGVYIAVIGATLEAWIPLLGQTTWPVMMRLGNVLELTGDASVRALLMALLVILPPKRERITAHTLGSDGVKMEGGKA